MHVQRFLYTRNVSCIHRTSEIVIGYYQFQNRSFTGESADSGEWSVLFTLLQRCNHSWTSQKCNMNSNCIGLIFNLLRLGGQTVDQYCSKSEFAYIVYSSFRSVIYHIVHYYNLVSANSQVLFKPLLCGEGGANIGALRASLRLCQAPFLIVVNKECIFVLIGNVRRSLACSDSDFQDLTRTLRSFRCSISLAIIGREPCNCGISIYCNYCVLS